MKKVYVIVISIAIITTCLIINQYYNHQTNEIITNAGNNSDNLISMMLENDEGQYEESKTANWPAPDKYYLNSKLSSCENGGNIS